MSLFGGGGGGGGLLGGLGGGGGGLLGGLGGGSGTGRGIIGGALDAPLGMLGIQGHNLPVIGSMFWDDPNELRMQEQQQQAAANLMARRPIQADAYMNALAQSNSALQPVQNLLGDMYGGQAQLDPSQLQTNPLPSEIYNNPNIGVPGAGQGNKPSFLDFFSPSRLAELGANELNDRANARLRRHQDLPDNASGIRV